MTTTPRPRRGPSLTERLKQLRINFDQVVMERDQARRERDLWQMTNRENLMRCDRELAAVQGQLTDERLSVNWLNQQLVQARAHIEALITAINLDHETYHTARICTICQLRQRARQWLDQEAT